MRRPDIVHKIKTILHQVAPQAEVKMTDITYPLYDLELSEQVTISPLVYTRKQWLNRPFKTPFYINVVNEGVRL